MPKWKVAGINFDHMHMPTLLGYVFKHPNAEMVGICHENAAKIRPTAERFGLPEELVFTDYRRWQTR